MKKILLFLIRFYQAIPFEAHKSCRHIPTCSDYMMQAIKEHGSIRGVKLGLKRLLKCRPFGTYGYDPVPKKEEKI